MNKFLNYDFLIGFRFIGVRCLNTPTARHGDEKHAMCFEWLGGPFLTKKTATVFCAKYLVGLPRGLDTKSVFIWSSIYEHLTWKKMSEN